MRFLLLLNTYVTVPTDACILLDVKKKHNPTMCQFYRRHKYVIKVIKFSNTHITYKNIYFLGRFEKCMAFMDDANVEIITRSHPCILIFYLNLTEDYAFIM